VTQIFVFTAGNSKARQHLEDSIKRQINADTVFENFPEFRREELEEIRKRANGFYAWGAIPGSRNRPNWESMESEDYVLCVYNATYQYIFRVLAKYDNKRFAETMWGKDDKRRTWQLMYFLTEPVEVGRHISEFGDYLEPERYWGFTKIDDGKIGHIISSYGSVDRLIAEMLGRERDDLHPQLSIPLKRRQERVSRQLRFYEDYSREEVHNIFAPDTAFTPQSGTWGIQGIVPIPNRPGDFVFFVTLGQEQAGYVFDEGITDDGVLTWQSQPHQGSSHPQIREFVEHDELKNSIYLFLRTKGGAKYTYLGQLKYLSHDTEREKPVHFQWQVLEWSPPEEILDRIGLMLQPPLDVTDEVVPAAKSRLEEAPPPPPRTRKGKGTRAFKTCKLPDPSVVESRNQELGRKGELLVVEHEKMFLTQNGRPDLAERVRHISAIEGDGAGYDIESFSLEGEIKYIEVKTTRGPAQTSFFISANEVEFAKQHQDNYYLYRVYDYEDSRNSGRLYVGNGDVKDAFELTPTQYRAIRF